MNLRALAVVCGLVLLWELVCLSGAVPPALLASPENTAVAFARLLGRAAGWHDLATTLFRILAGVTASIAIGVPLGLAIGHSRAVYDSTGGILDFARSVPPVVLYPLAILVFDPKGLATHSLVTFGCTAVILLHAAAGARRISPERTRMARVLGASRWQVFRHVTAYEALPQVVIGIRTALSLAIIIVVVSEMFVGFGGTAASRGLGVRLADAMTAFWTPLVYALILLIGLIGFAINRLALAAERRLIHWAR